VVNKQRKSIVCPSSCNTWYRTYLKLNIATLYQINSHMLNQ